MGMKLRNKLCIAITTASCATLIPSADSLAGAVLEEVIVTAQRREQNLQEVGISVTAFSAEQLQKHGYTNTLDVAMQTPGLSVAIYHATLANISIRGVSQNDYADQLESPIAVYVDDVYASNMGMASTQIFDLERIEILRGPQGTLFGRNATGGLLNYISNKPTDSFEAYAEVTAGDYDLLKIEGAVSGPLSNSIRGRLAFSRLRDDGYLENRLDEDLRDNDVWGVRGLLQFDIGESGDILLKGHYSKDDTNGNSYTHGATVANPSTFLGPLDPDIIPADGLVRFVPDDVDVYGTCPGCDPFGYKNSGNNPHVGSFGSQGFEDPQATRLLFKRDVWGVSAKLTYDFDDLTLVSITDYLDMDKEYNEDSDGSPFFGGNFGTETEVEQFSQELKLHGETDRLQWLVGVYYLEFDTDQFVDAPVTLTFGTTAEEIIPYSVTSRGKIESKSWAVYAHTEYALTSELSVTAALRYTDDERELKDHLNWDTYGTILPQVFGLPDISVSIDDYFPGLTQQDWDNYSARLALDWSPTDSLLVYASYTRGHKAGNFALPLAEYIEVSFGSTDGLRAMPHDEEVLHSYESGFKWEFLEGLARLNASVFYYDYDDYQASFFSGQTQIIENVDASITGGEVELVISPLAGLDISLGASYLDGEAEDITRTPYLAPADQTLPNSPDYTFNGLVRYEWPALRGVVAVQGDWNYSDSFCFTLICHPVEEEDSYLVGNVRVSYAAADNKWSVAAFVNNVGDEEYRQYGLNLESAVAGVLSGFAPPRWWGVTARYNL
jgi:iron complex outermembrane receptor protein